MRTSTRSRSTESIVMAGLLCATGIIIPMFMPKIVLEPASFTLASHVPVFIAMFISPLVAFAVAIGTTIGFLMSGLPVIIVMRALSHVVFATAGALWLTRYNLNTVTKSGVFAVVTSLIHAFAEFLVVTTFYFGGNVSEKFYENGFLRSVILLVFVGTFIHSIVDFVIAYVVSKPLTKSGVRLKAFQG